MIKAGVLKPTSRKHRNKTVVLAIIYHDVSNNVIVISIMIKAGILIIKTTS